MNIHSSRPFFFVPSETINNCLRSFGTSNTWSETVHYRPPVPTRHPHREPSSQRAILTHALITFLLSSTTSWILHPLGAVSHGVRAARASRGHGANYYVVYPGNTPANHPPTEACMIHSKQHWGCRIQDSGTRGYRGWKTADFSHSARTVRAQRTVRPLSLGKCGRIILYCTSCTSFQIQWIYCVVDLHNVGGTTGFP